MDEYIVFVPSAFKHGVTKEDIRWIIEHPLYEDLLEGYQDKYLVIGYDTKQRLLEIIYNSIDENTIKVFHAMKCTTKYLPLAGV
jgi:uncharacterized DUF497 family protein